MVTTRKFTDSIHKDLKDSAGFRRAFLAETITCMASGGVQTGQIALHEYINGTIGFAALGKALNKSPRNLLRMLSLESKPSACNLFAIIAYLQKAEGMELRLDAVDKAS